MIRETEKRLLPGAACAVLFVHGILGSPAQFAPFLLLVPQDWSFCNLLLQGHGGGARDFAAASMAVWREQTRQAFAELRAQHETRRTRPLVRQLAVPCRAYFSERDELVSVRSAREFADVPQAVVTMLPHSGHAYYEAQ